MSKIFDLIFTSEGYPSGWNPVSFGVSWSKSPLQPPRMMKGKCLNFILRSLVTNPRKFYHQKNLKNVFILFLKKSIQKTFDNKKLVQKTFFTFF